MSYKYLLFLLFFFPILGKTQFQVKVKSSNTFDSIAYFRASIFDEKNYIPKDTIKLNKGIAVIKNKKSIVGGIYFLYFPASKQKIQLVIEDRDTLHLNIQGKDYLSNATVNTIKNQIFLNYQKLENSLSHFDSSYQAALKEGKKFGQLQKSIFFKIKTDSLTSFRNEALKKLKKNDALYIHFNTLNQLDANVPNKRDYVARAAYFKMFDLKEPKLFFTPNTKQILSEYFSYYPLQADSLIKGVDTVFSKMLCTSKSYSYVFDYIAKMLKNREVQNNTEGYAYFLRKYVQNGTCNFLEKTQKETLLKELVQLQAQKIKDTCVNIQLTDTSDVQQDLHLFAKNFNYTIITFFDPSCEHCKVELPKMDSIISILEKQLLVKIGKYTICNAPAASKQEWVDFINIHKLSANYTHVKLGNETIIRNAYDAFSNPLFFLIDKDGLLLAKKISPNTLRKELIQAFQNFK